ncbi:MAG: trypsin-like peptidase domain-containing protein, partial [Acidobacteriota bacterium]
MTRCAGFERRLSPVLGALLVAGSMALFPAQLAAQSGGGSTSGDLENGGLKDLARKTSPSVALLRIYDRAGRTVGAGTGFVVGEGVLATNHHVIDGAAAVGAIFPERQELSLTEVLAEDPANDLALLSLPGSSEPLPLFRGSRVEPGESVVVIGNPEGLSGTVSTGIVSAIRENGLD